MQADDGEALAVYRAALMSLIEQAGGELFVVADTVSHDGGTILWRLEGDGIRFKFEAAGKTH